jgi:LytS/YehU family sensor histidine kinase
LSGSALRAAKGQDAHALAEELALCRAYLALETTRFGERLKVTIAVDDETLLERVRVPVLLLQTLLENSVRHGFGGSPESGPLSLHVTREQNAAIVIIEDDGAGYGPPRALGTGLANSERRLRRLFGGKASLDVAQREPRGTRARVRLPVDL